MPLSADAARVLDAMRNASSSVRIVDLRHICWLTTNEVRAALAELARAQLVMSDNFGMRYRLRERVA